MYFWTHIHSVISVYLTGPICNIEKTPGRETDRLEEIDRTVTNFRTTYSRFTSLQCELCSPTQRRLTPASCSSLPHRYRCVRLEELQLRTKARSSQHLSVSPQPPKLNGDEHMKMLFCLIDCLWSSPFYLYNTFHIR